MDKRRVAERVLLAVGAVTVSVGLLSAYVYDSMSDSEEFADRVAIAYSSPLVREQITDAVVDQIVDAEPDVVAVQPLLESVVSGVLAADSTTSLVRATTADLHRTVIENRDDTVTMQFAGLILVAKTQLTALDPEAGALIPDDLTDAIVEITTEPVFVDVVQTVDRLRVIAMLVPLLGALSFAGALWLSRSTTTGIVRLGLALAAAGVLAAVIERMGRRLAVDTDTDVAGIVWDAFMNDLATWTVATAAVGGVLAAVAWFGIGELGVGRLTDRIRPIIRQRDSSVGRAVWGVGAVVVGLVIMIEWEMVARFGITVAGAVVLAAGLQEIVGVVAPGLVHGVNDADPDELAVEADHQRVSDPRRVGRWVITGVLVLVGIGATAAVAASGGSSDNEVASGCNGDRRLCDRRLDEVVLPATHNSHAAADEGFLLGYQRGGIESQLNAGVRALLIDVYFGREVDDAVITDRAPLTGTERDDLVAQVGEAAVRSAEATAVRADATGVDRELFLCHALCEIGASRFDGELGVIARFLNDRPGEVLVLIIQDEGPRPADIATAFEHAGLIDQLHAQPVGEPWPTLGELIDADTRVIVFAENLAGGGFDWYHDAFAHVQDTPFSFETLDDFSCDLYRGEADHGLFLVNHWLSPAAPSSAASANAADVITARFDKCAEQRGQMPNMIAVDFYSTGALIETVADLNQR